jgi:phage gp36-like protein
MFSPIFETLGDESSKLVGMLSSIIAFDNYLSDLLPDGVKGIILVLRNSCGDAATYELTGNKVSTDLDRSFAPANPF